MTTLRTLMLIATLAVIVIIQGCAYSTPGRLGKGDPTQSFKPEQKISIIPYQTWHEGSLMGQTIANLATIGRAGHTAMGSPTDASKVLSTAAHTMNMTNVSFEASRVAEQSGPLTVAGEATPKKHANDYLSDLNRRSYQKIEEILKRTSQQFTYLPTQSLSLPMISSPSELTVGQLVEANHLDRILSLNLSYFAVKGSFKKALALQIDWTILDANGNEITKIRTVNSFMTDQVFPNTKDPQYRDRFIEAAEKNTEDFLLILQGQEPKYGRQSLMFRG